MYMCEECNYVWDVQRSIGDPDVRQCPKCLSYEIEETSPSNVPHGQATDRERSAYVQLSDVRDLVEMVEAIPCICEECYTSRKLTQPDCPRCNYIDMDIVNKVKAHF